MASFFLNVSDVNGVGLLKSRKVRAKVVADGIEVLEGEQFASITNPDSVYSVGDAKSCQITIAGTGYRTLDFTLENLGSDWSVTVSGHDDEEKRAAKIVARAWAQVGLFDTSTGPLPIINVTMPRLWLAALSAAGFAGAGGKAQGEVVLRHTGVVKDASAEPPYARCIFDDLPKFNILNSTIFPSPPAPSAADFGRFQSKEVALHPKAESWFRLFEYGALTGPRFMIAVWAPKNVLVGGNGMDMVVLISPQTQVKPVKGHPEINLYPPSSYPFRDDYPFAESVVPLHPTKSGQAYCALPYVYLLNEQLSGRGFAMALQLLAARKSAVVVMPVSPYGSWGPMMSRSGLWRMLKEVSYAVLGSSDNAPANQTKKVSPNINRVALCGYSAGAQTAQSIFADDGKPLHEGQQGYDEFTWGAPKSEFMNVWKEFWDIDGQFGALAGLRTFQQTLAAWASAQGDRCTRSYHTHFTLGAIWQPGEDFKKNPTAYTRMFGASPLINPASATGADAAQEMHSENGQHSAVYFPDSLLMFPAKSDLFESDSHHVIPKIAFGHAAAASKMASLPTP
jgi:hypothetical protein